MAMSVILILVMRRSFESAIRSINPCSNIRLDILLIWCFGMLDDPIQLGAISLAFPVFLVIQAIGNIFSMGAPAYISRTLGAKDYDEVKRTSSVAHYLAILVIVLISILFFNFGNADTGHHRYGRRKHCSYEGISQYHYRTWFHYHHAGSHAGFTSRGG